MAKNIDIPIEKWMADLKLFFHRLRTWFEDFFRTITTYEAIAVGAIGVGFVLVIVSLFIL